MSKPHEQLEAWKFAMQLAKSVYQLTSDFPVEERYGLAQQMRRAAVSIPSNIAEGAGRNGAKEYLYFIGISRGSLAERGHTIATSSDAKFYQTRSPCF